MTSRHYGQGRTARAPEARLTKTELARLRAVEQRDGVSHADWIMRHVEEDEMDNRLKYRTVTSGRAGREIHASFVFDDRKSGTVICGSGHCTTGVRARGSIREAPGQEVTCKKCLHEIDIHHIVRA